MTKGDKVKWDKVFYHKQEAELNIQELREILKAEPNHPERKEIEDEIRYSKRTFEMIKRALE